MTKKETEKYVRELHVRAVDRLAAKNKRKFTRCDLFKEIGNEDAEVELVLRASFERTLKKRFDLDPPSIDQFTGLKAG